MIRTMYVICASRVLRNAEDNRMSIVDVLDDFVAQGFPIVYPRTSMLWVLARDEGDAQQMGGNVAISLNNTLLQQFPVQINFENQMKTRAIATLVGMTIFGPGTLKFAFSRADQEEPDATFEITIAAGPAQLVPGADPPPAAMVVV